MARYTTGIRGLEHAADPATTAKPGMLIGAPSLATNATTGFLHIPTCAGAPTGTPSPLVAGYAPIVYDTTNNKLWVYNVGWKGVVLA